MVGRWRWRALVAATLGCSPSVEVLEPADASSGSGSGLSGPMTGLPMGTTGGTTLATAGNASSDDSPCPPMGCWDVNLPDPQCEVAADCALDDSCCWCLASPVGDPRGDDCPADCAEGMCEVLGVTEAACSSVFGRPGCVASRDCDPAHVECNATAPLCADGMLPTVVDGCWSDCIPVRSCFGAGSCGNCLDGDVCLEYPFEDLVVCIEPLEGCTEATCDCLPEDVCELSPYYCDNSSKRPACYPELP